MSYRMVDIAFEIPNIKPLARLVFMALGRHYNTETRECYPSLDRICALTGMDKKSVIRHRDDLVAAGHITCVSDKGRTGSCRYEFAGYLHSAIIAKKHGKQYSIPSGAQPPPPVAESHHLSGIEKTDPVAESHHPSGSEPLPPVALSPEMVAESHSNRLVIDNSNRLENRLILVATPGEPCGAPPLPPNPEPEPDPIPESEGEVMPATATQTEASQAQPTSTTPAAKAKRPRKSYTADFDAFWAAYHPARRLDKADAMLKWKSVVTSDEIRDAIMADLKRRPFTEQWQGDPHYVKYPSRYLSKACWLDEYEITDSDGAEDEEQELDGDWCPKAHNIDWDAMREFDANIEKEFMAEHGMTTAQYQQHLLVQKVINAFKCWPKFRKEANTEYVKTWAEKFKILTPDQFPPDCHDLRDMVFPPANVVDMQESA